MHFIFVHKLFVRRSNFNLLHNSQWINFSTETYLVFNLFCTSSIHSLLLLLLIVIIIFIIIIVIYS